MKKRLTLQDKAFIALKKAVREVVEHHKKTGRPLAVWHDGKVKMVSANQILRKHR
jgi:hypothetical protein